MIGEQISFHLFCQQHTPLLLKKKIESNQKRYRDEIVKFCKATEKYLINFLESPSPIKEKKKKKALIHLPSHPKEKVTEVKPEKKKKPPSTEKIGRDNDMQEFMDCLHKKIVETRQKNYILLQQTDSKKYRVLYDGLENFDERQDNMVF